MINDTPPCGKAMPRIIIDVYTKISKYVVTWYTGKHVTIKNWPQERFLTTSHPASFYSKFTLILQAFPREARLYQIEADLDRKSREPAVWHHSHCHTEH